jgi:hypothetical protein
MPITLVPRERRLALRPLVIASGSDIHGQEFTEATHAVDVSGSGLCFESVHNLLVGTRLAVRVFIPEAVRRRLRDRQSFAVRAMVARIVPASERERFRVGLKMLGPLAAEPRLEGAMKA